MQEVAHGRQISLVFLDKSHVSAMFENDQFRIRQTSCHGLCAFDDAGALVAACEHEHRLCDLTASIFDLDSARSRLAKWRSTSGESSMPAVRAA